MNNLNNTIKLVFDRTITRLAGYQFGENVFKQQVETEIDYNSIPITIEFPDNIIKAASSFTQGFFKEIIQKFGYDFIGKQVNIISPNQSLIESIKENLV